MTVCLPAKSFSSVVIWPAPISSNCRRDNCTKISSNCCLVVTRAASRSVFVVGNDMQFFFSWGLEHPQPIEQWNPVLPRQARGSREIRIGPNTLQHHPRLFQRAAGLADSPHSTVAACNLNVSFQRFRIVLIAVCRGRIGLNGVVVLLLVKQGVGPTEVA